MRKFAPGFPLSALIASDVARREGIDNTPSPTEEKRLLEVSWFLYTLAYNLKLRGRPNKIVITSGFRCGELNSAVGGADTSYHTLGLAVDFVVVGMSTFELARFITNTMVEFGYDQVINEFGRWVHVSVTKGALPKLQELTATKDGGRTVYRAGIVEVEG